MEREAVRNFRRILDNNALSEYTIGAVLGLELTQEEIDLAETRAFEILQEYDGVLDCISLALTANFNRHGTLLAVGCNDGRVVIWDFMTRGISKVISAHTHPVCSVSWVRKGKKILTASVDNTVAVIDVLTGDIDNRFRLPSPVLKVQFHPRNTEKFLICPMHHPVLLVNMDSKFLSVPAEDETDPMIVAAFDRRGDFIITGNSKGRVEVFRTDDGESMEAIASFRIGQAGQNVAIKSIEFSRKGEWFLINSSDRIIRVYDLNSVIECVTDDPDSDPEPIQKLQDLVNKTMWKKCCFSGDGEYVCAGSARQHALYIWEKTVGNLVKILHGTKGELLLDVVWHPVRPIIASISSGVVSIWSQNQVENWSAFAPDFKELDENVEYDERESEFDIEDEDKIVELSLKKGEADIEADVTTIEPIQAFVSSDEEDLEVDPSDVLTYLPIAPDIEEPEESWANCDQIIATTTTHPSEDSYKRHHSERESAHQKEKENIMSPTGGGSSSSTKRKKVKTFDIFLANAPVGEIHPILNSKPGKEKPKKTHTSRDKKHKDKYSHHKY